MASITTRQAAEAPGAKAKEKTYPLMSRREIEGLIADGRTVFILDGFVLKADAWKKYHPGGDKAMLHMIGRDATDEVTVLVELPVLSHSNPHSTCPACLLPDQS